MNNVFLWLKRSFGKMKNTQLGGEFANSTQRNSLETLVGVREFYFTVYRMLHSGTSRKLPNISYFKPWPNGLASGRKFSVNLPLLATPFGQDLRELAFTCDDLRSLWSRSSLHASRRKFFTVWPPNPSQRKCSDVH